MKGFRKLGDPLFAQGLTSRLRIGTRMTAGGITVTYSISGFAYDADGSTGVSGATIALGGYTATSAANGSYTISDIPPGTSGSMTCTKAGYSWTAKTIAAMSGDLTAQNYTNAWWAFGGISASALAVFQPRGAASLSASKVNLANPGTYDATAGSNPTFGATGWTFDGSNNYLVSACPTNNKPCTYIVRLTTTNMTGYRSILGCSDDEGISLDLTQTTNVPRLMKMNVAVIGVATAGFNQATDTVIAVTYTAGNVWTHYLNGSANGTGTQDRAPFSSRTLMIGAQDTTATQKFPGVIAGIAIYNVALDATQIAAISTALAAVP